MSNRWTAPAVILCLGALGLPACEEKKEAAPKPGQHADGGAPIGAGVDKNIAEAVAAVAGGAGAAPSGPPETGVFAPGAADREMGPSDPPKLSLGGKGEGPTVTFVSAPPKAGKKLTARAEVAVQTGPRSAMPTIDLSLAFEPAKAAEPGDAPAPVELTAKVTQAKLAADQPGQLPPGVDAQVSKSKGSVVRFVVAPSGAGRIAGVETSKESDPSLAQVVYSASEALALAFLPYPTEPVGVGAFWMVTSRERFAGLDVVAYRMIKLQKVEGDQAVLEVEAKRYAAGGQLGFPGLPPHKVLEFQGNTKAQLIVTPSEPSKLQGQLNDVVLANVEAQGQVPGQPPGAPAGQKLSLHVEVRTQVSVGR